jgi:hypothetical protein
MLVRALGYTRANGQALAYPTGYLAAATGDRVALIGTHVETAGFDLIENGVSPTAYLTRNDMAMLLYNFLLTERFGLDVARNPINGLLETQIIYTPVLRTFGMERLVGYITGVRNYAANVNVYNVSGEAVSLGAGTPFGERDRNNIEIRGIGFNPIQSTVDAFGLDADYADARAVELLGRRIDVFRTILANDRRPVPNAILVGVRTDVTYADNAVVMNTAMDRVDEFTLGTNNGAETFNQRGGIRDLSLITNFAVLGTNGIAASSWTVAAQTLIDSYGATGAPARPATVRPEDAADNATAAQRAEVAALQAAWDAYRHADTGALALRTAAQNRELELARLIAHQTAAVRNYRLIHIDNGTGLNGEPSFLYIYQPVQIGYVTRVDAQRLRIETAGNLGRGPYQGAEMGGYTVADNRAFHATTNLEGFQVRTIEGGPEGFVVDRAYMFTRSGYERDDITPIRELVALETGRVLEATTMNTLRFRGTTAPVTFEAGNRFRALEIWGNATTAQAERIRDAQIGGTFTVWGDEDGTPYFARRTVEVVTGPRHHDTFGWVVEPNAADQMQVLIGGRMVRRVRIVDAATGLQRTINIVGETRDEVPAAFTGARRLLALRPIDESDTRFYDAIVIPETLATGFSNDLLPRTDTETQAYRRFALASAATPTGLTGVHSANIATAPGFNLARTIFAGEVNAANNANPRTASIVTAGANPTRFMVVDGDGVARIANNAEQVVTALSGSPITRYAVVGVGTAANAGAARLVFLQTTAPVNIIAATPRLGIMTEQHVGHTFVDGSTHTTGTVFELSAGDAVYTDVIIAGANAAELTNGTLVEILSDTIDGRNVVRLAATADQTGTAGDSTRTAANLMASYNAQHIGRFLANPADLAGRYGATTTVMGAITGYSSGNSITIAGHGVIPLRGMNTYNLLFIAPHGTHGATNAAPANWTNDNVARAVKRGGMSATQFGHLSANQRAIVTHSASGYAVAVTIVTFGTRAGAHADARGFFDDVNWLGRADGFGWDDVRTGADTTPGIDTTTLQNLLDQATDLLGTVGTDNSDPLPFTHWVNELLRDNLISARLAAINANTQVDVDTAVSMITIAIDAVLDNKIPTLAGANAITGNATVSGTAASTTSIVTVTLPAGLTFEGTEDNFNATGWFNMGATGITAEAEWGANSRTATVTLTIPAATTGDITGNEIAAAQIFVRTSVVNLTGTVTVAVP